MIVEVEMTETVTYRVQVPHEAFALLIGESGASPERLKEVAHDPNNADANFGLEGCPELLNFVRLPANEVGLEDRVWAFSFPELLSQRVKAPQYEPDWDDPDLGDPTMTVTARDIGPADE